MAERREHAIVHARKRRVERQLEVALRDHQVLELTIPWRILRPWMLSLAVVNVISTQEWRVVDSEIRRVPVDPSGQTKK
jgi:hypothetical protein